jgi:SAM-dependent methyltransferase
MDKIVTNRKSHQSNKQCGFTVYDRFFYKQTGVRHLQSTITKIAKKLGAKEVLDVGAGSGWLVKSLRKNGFKACGIDNSPLAIKKGLVKKGQAINLPYASNRFDLVTAVSLIEHLNSFQAEKFLREVKRVLKPKGYLFLITPNYSSPTRLIQGKRWYGFLDPTHLRFYTPFSLKKLLIKNGFYNLKFTFPAPEAESFDWTIPKIFKKLPKPIKYFINFLAISTWLALLKNSFSVLAQSKKIQNG